MSNCLVQLYLQICPDYALVTNLLTYWPQDAFLPAIHAKEMTDTSGGERGPTWTVDERIIRQ